MGEQNQRSKSFAWGVLVGFGCALLVTVPVAHAVDVDGTYQKLRVYSQVLSYVQSSYVEEKKGDELIYDSIHGMMQHLDPHSVFLRPAEYEKLREDTSGEFGGLGLEVTADHDDVVVEQVVGDGPAANAGLRIGDHINAIDDETTAGKSLESAVRLMRGLPGTRVVLRLTRPAWDKPHDVALVRRQVRIPSVEADDLGDGRGYVRIRVFQERTDVELENALAQLRKTARTLGHKDIQGLVLDMRDNPGGLLDEGVKVADRFLSQGLIVTTQGRNPKSRERELARPDGTEPDYPISILVNGGTASASEIVAGALQDHRRATIVGSQSYGKGSVQTLFGLDDGAGLKLTVAKYYTPSGRSIQGTGITPDVPQKAAAEGPHDDTKAKARLATDPQLAAALQALSRPRVPDPLH